MRFRFSIARGDYRIINKLQIIMQFINIIGPTSRPATYACTIIYLLHHYQFDKLIANWLFLVYFLWFNNCFFLFNDCLDVMVCKVNTLIIKCCTWSNYFRWRLLAQYNYYTGNNRRVLYWVKGRNLNISELTAYSSIGSSQTFIMHIQ